MPSFPVKDADQLASYIIPVTTDMANEMIRTVTKTDHDGYFAVYGPDADGKRGKWAVTVTLQGDYLERWYYVYLDEYHPRTNGKAQIEFGK